MTTSPLRRLWYAWKALNLPWRKKYLAGADLAGNTFWQLKASPNSPRARRILQPVRGRRTHLSDVQITPQWHQWLRHTRLEPPSMQEQELDLQRQASMARLAQLADERWASKPSLLDGPELMHSEPEMKVRDPGGYAQAADERRQGVKNAVGSAEEVIQKKTSPWAAKGRGAAGEDWQPQVWDPNMASAKK